MTWSLLQEPRFNWPLDSAGVCTHLDSLLGILVKSLSLGLKDLCISLEEVLSLHALPARHGSHQDGHVDILEGLGSVSSRDNL